MAFIKKEQVQPAPEYIQALSLYDEAFRFDYPNRPLPDVHPARLYVASIGKGPPLSPENELLAVFLANRVNTILGEKARSLHQGQANQFMTLLRTDAETRDYIAKAAAAVYTIAHRFPKTELILPPAGPTKLGKLLSLMGVPTSRMHSFEVSGTNGMVTGKAEVKSHMPEFVRQQDQLTLLVEDIADSAGTTAASVLAILEERSPDEYTKTIHGGFLTRLEKAHESGNSGDVYIELAQMCAAVGLVPFFVVSKNSDFDWAIQNIAKRRAASNPLWNRIVLDLHDLYPVSQLPNVWVMNQLADTDCAFTRLRGCLWGADLQNHPMFREGIRDEKNQLKLRLGLIPQTAYIQYPEQEENIIELAAGELTKLVTQRSLSASWV